MVKEGRKEIFFFEIRRQVKTGGISEDGEQVRRREPGS